MRSHLALSLAFFAVSALACGGRTQVDDEAPVDHNQTLMGGSAGATSASTGKGGTTSPTGKGGSGPIAAGGGPVPAVGMGGSVGTVGGVGAGGSVGTAGSMTGKAGTSSAAGGSTSTGKGGSGTGANGGTNGKGGMTGKGGAGGKGGKGTPCDAEAQTGCGPGQKCSAQQQGMGNLTSACEPLMGDVMEGGDCKRTMIGLDNCGPDLICTGIGVVDYDPNKNPPHRQCRKFCSQDSDCGATQGCTQFTQDGFGVCVDSCLPFSACDPASPTTMGSAGNNGGADVSCSAVLTDNDQQSAFLGCHKVGKGKQNANCQTDQECAANYFCGGGGPGGGGCQQLCDDTHPCEQKGTTCNTGGPGQIGACQ